MNLKRYINEWIILLSIVLLVGAYWYKHHQLSKQTEQVSQAKHTLTQVKEVVALEKIWGDKKITQKIEALHKIISPSKVQWSKKQNKVTATFNTLTANELNKLMTKLLNVPVSITLLEVNKIAENYEVELKCKW